MLALGGCSLCRPIIPRSQMVEAMLFIGRTGCQWRYLPKPYGAVATARSIVLAEGGRAARDAVTLPTANGRRVTWVSVTDPEGNIVELQSWAEAD